MAPKLKPHQAAILDNIQNGKVLTGGVGTGKTITSLFYFFEKVCGGTVGDFGSIKTPKDLYVFTTARKRDSLDWQDEAIRFGLYKDPNISVAGITLTVDSYNNIGKYVDVKDAFIILDEQRMVGSGAWTKAFLKLAKVNEWIMLSATPGDTWLDYIPLFIANGFYKNRTQFVREHCVYSHYGPYPKLERYVSVNKLVRLKNSILVEMPYEKHTKRHIHEVPVDFDSDLFNKVVNDRWHVYEDRPLRDVGELFSVMRKVANTDSSRLQQVRRLMTKHPRLIVFYNFDYELEMLRELVKGQSLSTSATLGSMGTQPLRGATPTSMPRTSIRQNGRDTTPSSAGPTNPSTGSPSSSSGRRTGLEDMSSSSIRVSPSTPSEVPLDSPSPTSLRRKQPTTSIDPSRGGTETSNRPSKTTPSTRSRDSSNLERQIDTEPRSRRKHSRSENGSDGSSGLVLAEWNGHKHEPVPTSERWVYLVQYMAGAEAWNCTATDAVAYFSLTYSYKLFEQSQGRIDRLDTPFTDLHYYVLMSKSFIDRVISKALKSKKNFNESETRLYT